MLKILEHQNTFTPLGIRFWDPLFNVQIRDALEVTVRSENVLNPKTTAYRTLSDIYTFSHIPGLREIEHRESSRSPSVSSPDSKPVVVEIKDASHRFVDTTMKINLPLAYPGVYLAETIGMDSPTVEGVQGFYLFSSSIRKVPRTIASVFAQLVDNDSGQPAAHARMKITSQDGQRWYGLADVNGRVAVHIHYPELTNGFSTSPYVATNNKPWFKRSWELAVRVFYEPQVLDDVNGTEVPDYKSIMQQDQGTIWEPLDEEGLGSPALFESSVVTVNMHYGKNLVLKTAGASELFVSPATTSP